MTYPDLKQIHEKPGTPVVSSEVSLEHRGPRLWLPFAMIIVVTSFWALTLQNSIFIDESVYIMAGREYLDHWINGTPLPENIGEGFSGLPMLYPVLAGAIDTYAGLWGVRMFSLFCIIVTLFLIRAITSYAFNRRAGLMAAGIFGFAGPVLYVGHLGTFDALVITLLAGALYLGLCREGWISAIAMGGLLALAVGCKYTAYVFVPPVLVFSLFGQYELAMSSSFKYWIKHPHIKMKRLGRAGLAAATAASIVYVAWTKLGDQIQEALKFTTTGRHALSPMPADQLAWMVPSYSWIAYSTALLGLIWLLYTRRWTAVLFGLGLIATSLLLPLAQMRLGEAVSFEKHMAYSTLFLAPLAGWGLARPWRLAIWAPVLVWAMAVAVLWGSWKSHDLIMYPDVSPVVEELGDNPEPGTYLSSSADSLLYYTRDNEDVEWLPTSTFYVRSDQEIHDAVASQEFTEIILFDSPTTGSTIQDAGQAKLKEALDDTDAYKVTDIGDWLIYRMTER